MSEKGLRVAMISIHGDPAAALGGDGAGGQNVYVKETALALGRRHVAVDIFTRRADEDAPEIEHLGERTRVIRLRGGEARYINRDELHLHMPAFSEALIGFIRQQNLSYDALHTHYWHSGWTGLRVKAAFNVPHFHTTHSLGAVKHQHVSALPGSADIRISVEREILSGCDCIVATCPQEEETIRNYYTPHSSIAVIPCGVNLTHFRPFDREESRRAVGLKGDESAVLFVGRLDERKGLSTLLKAVALLSTEHDETPLALRLIVVGGTTTEGVDERDYKRALAGVARLGLGEVVQFAGRLPHERLGLYYTAADVVTIPSNYEPFGLVALEAMACGVPVVASKVGGLQYSIEDGETGILVPPGDHEALAAAIKRLLSDDELHERMRRNATARARRHFDWSHVADRLLALYLREQNAAPPARIFNETRSD